MPSHGLANVELKAFTLILTADCNLRCSYCYQNAKQRASMTWETARAAVDFLFTLPSTELELHFQGGEPLLESGTIVETVDYVRRQVPEGKTLKYEICTNGTLLDQALLDFLARNRFEVRISFDGVPAMQDWRGAGTFRRLDRLLDCYMKEQPDHFETLGVNITLAPRAILHLAESVEYLLGKGIRKIGVSPVFNPDTPWTEGDAGELRRQFSRIFDICLRHLRRTGDSPFLPFRQSRLGRLHRSGECSMCEIVRGKSLTVDVDGRVYGCAALAESYLRIDAPLFRSCQTQLALGHLQDPAFLERLAAFPEALARAEVFHHKERKYSSSGRCSECRYIDCCHVCPLSIVMNPRNQDLNRVPDFACAFYKIASAYRDCFPMHGGTLSVLLAGMEAARIASESDPGGQ